MESYIKQRQPLPGEDILGLQASGYVLFPDAKTQIEIPFVNNKFKLGSDSTTQFGLTKAEQQKFENYFGIKFDSDEGKSFLSDYKIEISHLANPIDHNNTEHEFVYSILKANNGFGIVDLGDSKNADYYPPFVLVNKEKEMEKNVSRITARNEAITKLESLKLDPKYIVKIAKYIFNLNVDLTPDQAYLQLNDYIADKFENSRKFIEALTVDVEWLDTTVAVKDAINLGIIRRGEDQVYVNYANHAKLGRTVDEVIRFLNNPDNQDMLGTGGNKDQTYAIKAQIKSKLHN